MLKMKFEVSSKNQHLKGENFTEHSLYKQKFEEIKLNKDGVKTKLKPAFAVGENSKNI